MKLLLVPRPLLLFQVEAVHARLADLVISRAPLDDPPLVVVVRLEVEVAEAGPPVDSVPDVGQEGRERRHVEGTPELLRDGSRGGRCAARVGGGGGGPEKGPGLRVLTYNRRRVRY